MSFGFEIRDSSNQVILNTTRIGAFFGGILDIPSSDTSGVYRGDGLGGRPNLTGIQTIVLQYVQKSAQGAFNFRLYNITVKYCKIINGVEDESDTLALDRYPKIIYNLALNQVPVNSTTSGSVFLIFLGGQ
jgi:hypothetical protein